MTEQTQNDVNMIELMRRVNDLEKRLGGTEVNPVHRPIICRVTNTNGQAIAAGVLTPLTWTALANTYSHGAASDDTSLAANMWSIGDPTKLYARIPGWYSVGLTTILDARNAVNWTFARVLLYPTGGGLTVGYLGGVNAASATFNDLVCGKIPAFYMHKDDYVVINMYTDTARNITASDGAGNNNFSATLEKEP